MIDHDRALELAATALDFGLDDAERDELQSHLDACAACRATDEQIRGDAHALADLPMVDAPEALRTRVLEATASSGEVDPAVDPPTRRRQAGATRAGPMIPPTYRRPVAMAAAAAIVVAVIGGMLFWRSTPNGGPDVAATSPSAGPAASPSPTPQRPSSQVAAHEWAPVAELTAEDVQGGVVGLSSGFRLASLDGTPAADLAARLTANPPIAFSVAADADGRSARITPTEPLTAGALYRFTLAADDGGTLDSWAFQAHQPLRIVGTLPSDTESGVPTNTGIEIAFDQDGVVDAADHMTIEPRIEGRFEQHGRTLAFVPAQRLTAATIYTVTVSRGVAVGGTGEVLESDVRFRFETAAAGATGKVQNTFQFTDDVVESATADRATIATWVYQDSPEDSPDPKPPTTARVEVHRLDDLDHAIAAFRQVRAAPRWARAMAADLVPTKDLAEVAAFTARLREQEPGYLWFQLPKRLPAGWYVVTLRSGTRPVQTILQVTDIAGYLAISETKTLVWANDIASGRPVAGATVATDGVDLGRTGADGSRVVETPVALMPSGDDPCTDKCFPVVTVRSGDRAAFLPATGQGQEGAADYSYPGANHAVRFWSTFDTDRTLYRRTDTVNAWGVVRDRDSGEVPASVTIRLYATDGEGGGEDGAPLSRTELHPNAIGAFSGSIAIDDLPEGDYLLESSVADDIVDSVLVRVDRILKPAYRLEVLTGRRVYFQGDQIRVTAAATFYEGSPVPGVPLRLDGFVTKSFTTDSTGTATVRTTVRFDDNEDDSGESDVRQVSVTPARAEEGAISGASREIVVFPSMWTIDATGLIADGRVRVTGSLHAVDRDRLELEIATGKRRIWELDPTGDPIAGKTVTATFTELIPYRTQTGTQYDFIEKKVIPVYEYGSNDRAAGTVRITTQKDGSFSASIKAPDADHTYKIRLTATDPDRHQARWVQWISNPGANDTDTGSALVLTSDPTRGGADFGVGDRIDLTMDPGRPAERTDRYLFYTAQRGLRDAAVQSSARYRGTFAEWAAPGMSVTGVRFTGSGYVESPSFQATFRKADRELTVGLTTNEARYDPGAAVTLTVTTRDSTGKPVPASVVLRGVDEKLFTIGAAEPADPLGELYLEVESGIVATYRTHHEPSSSDEGGDTTGGGGDEAAGRQDFRDWILFRKVDTGQDGRAVVTFNVSDDLTSWRVSASAFGPGPTAGESSIGIPVGLPFFVDATIAPEYLVSDRPAIALRAFGTALEAGAPVTFAIDSESLRLHVDGLRANAFETEMVPLPKLTVGNHLVTITATTGSGASMRRDVMTRTLNVVSSRLARTRAEYVEPTAGTAFKGGDGPVDVIVSDAGPARYVSLLLDLTNVESARLERTLAASVAGTIARDRFGLVDSVPAPAFDGSTYQTESGGLAILPYAAQDLEASTLAALVAADRFDGDRLAEYLSSIAGSATETRERRMIALAGLGGLHAAVLPRIREAAANPDLTTRERLFIGLGAAALGDSATARSIGTALVASYGEITNDEARLRVGESAADITAGTALMAMLAAANGDPLAGRFWTYVEANPDVDTTYSLHAVGYVTSVLARQGPRTASFAYTIAGAREVVELDAGETFHVLVSHEQFASLAIEPVSGQIGVTTSWRETVKPTAFTEDPDLAISRRMTPSGTIGTAALVRVDLTVDIGQSAPAGCHLVTDIVPSGLVPVGNLQGWVDPDSEPSAPAGVVYPTSQIGQVVSFCADRGTAKGPVHLRYFARVVTTGTYTWEPAVVSSRTSTDRAALTKAMVVTIR